MSQRRISRISVRIACAVVSGSLLLLTGCSNTIVRPVREFTVNAPPAWSGAEVEGSAEGGDWWAYFDDDALDRAIREALSCSDGLRSVAARIDAASQQLKIAGAADLPTIGLGVSTSRGRQNFVGLPFPTLGTRVLSNTFNTAGLSINIAWEADLWNRVGANKLAAMSDIQVQEADLAAARLSLSGQVAKAWLAGAEATRQAEFAKASLLHAEERVRRVQARFRAGSVPSAEIRLAQGEVDRAQMAVSQRQLQRSAYVRQIETLTCRYPKGEYALREDLPALPSAVPAGLPSELVHRRPDLRSLESALVGADARTAATRADLRPSFSLTTFGGTTTDTLKDVVNPTFQAWNLALGFAQPLFDGGRLKAVVEVNEARAREVAAAYQSQMLIAYREVETALAAERVLSEQEATSKSVLSNTNAALSLTESRYRSGRSDVMSLLALRRSVIDAESALLSVQRARFDNRVDLHLALGGGFAATPDRPLGLDSTKVQ